MLTHASYLMPQTELFKKACLHEHHRGLAMACLTSYVPQVDVEMSHLYLEETLSLPYIKTRGFYSGLIVFIVLPSLGHTELIFFN